MTDSLRAIVRAAALVPSPLAKYRPEPGRHEVHGDVALTAAGLPGPDFNYVAVVGPTPPARVFALADAFYGDPHGYSVVVEVEAARPLDDELRARGWRLDEEEPALALAALPAAPPPPPDGLAIRQVTDEAGLEDFLAVSETGRRHVPSLVAALDPDVGLFVGYVDGRAVATSRLSRLGDVAEIMGVVADPAYRRRGYGTALTWAAVAGAAARGCRAVTLTASPLGYPVYVRMGFAPVCTFRTYLPPEAS
ncbi:MAG TPA: GNAT family N-acetyltransferase [Thermomicrobiales bacterium]|nr:GNAT family N-acetyltransferase [Thermomicrobiales bacterium]